MVQNIHQEAFLHNCISDSVSPLIYTRTPTGPDRPMETHEAPGTQFCADINDSVTAPNLQSVGDF